MLTALFPVALGGAIGASLRYLVGVMALRLAGPGFPYATMAVNIAGSFAMGAIAVTLARKGGHAAWAPFVMTGVLGGFTTFSAFSLDALTLYERGQIGAAAGYVVGSVVLSLGALVLGMAVARGVLS